MCLSRSQIHLILSFKKRFSSDRLGVALCHLAGCRPETLGYSLDMETESWNYPEIIDAYIIYIVIVIVKLVQ